MKTRAKTPVAIALMAGMAFLSSIYALQGCLLTRMIDFYHLTDSSQGLSSSMMSFGGVLALISSFFLIGRIPKLTLLRIAIAVCTVFLALLKFAPGFAVFVVIWLMIGIGNGYVDNLLSACMADLYSGRACTRMLCLLHCCYGLSSMIVPILLNAQLNSGTDWKNLFLFTAGFGFVLLVYAAIAIRATGRNRENTAGHTAICFADMKRVYAGGALPMLVGAMFSHGMFLGGLNVWINRYVDVTLNSSVQGMALSSMFLGVMVSRLIICFSRIDTKKYICSAGFASAAVFAAAIVIRSGVFTTAAVGVVGLCFGAMIPCMLDIGCAATPENTMLATSGMMLSMYIGQVIISPLIGTLETAFNLHVGMVMCAALMALASLFCCLAVRKLRGQDARR